MNAPLTRLRQICLRQLAQAALTLRTDTPQDAPLRYRPDGKGGVLASPYPMQVGLPPEAIAAACPGDPWLTEIAPSGQWLAFTPSDAWYEEVRRYQPPQLETPPGTKFPAPPADCPARLELRSWCLCCLLGKPDPLLAARLDLENPRLFLDRVRNQALTRRGSNRTDFHLLRECVLLEEHLKQQDAAAAARQALAVARRYAAAPAEDATVGKLLDRLPWI